MIRDQCHAYCQCSFCSQEPQDKSTNAGASMRAAMQSLSRPGMSKDELYMKSLQKSLREKALLDSSKNVGRFIPDEQLLSSSKKRAAKEMALAAEMVPVRRRDRLQELLLLEHKARLDEEARVRAERRALGLPEEETEAEEGAEGSANEAEAPTPASSQREVATPSQQRLSSGAVTPASQCSAEHDLHTMLKGIRDIVDEDPAAAASAPLNQQQVFKLRQLMYNQKKKTREMVDSCENQPHVCGHCLDVNVQARHLCAPPQESVAFGLTGKVINPEEGVKYGTDAPRGFGGTYSTASVDPAYLSSKKIREGNYSNHPYGAGMVFLPISSVNAGGSRKGQTNNQSARFRASFNNNIGPGEPVEADLQFPGSTYNVYDKPASQVATPAAQGDVADRSVKIDTASSNASSQNAANVQKGPAATGNAAACR
ncbi:hypothetical protein ABB37_01068 [Leptomonas pyrrhocoris]|uniref:Uncharacterized protein n=1 Tax=Leptomonas pyrrhocoris TaxID=157538 RepID=A0A0N0DYT4_LEPPY|nr:hypothetical protein ABB37_01068 [Leptomonas pyrrhocoris]XP_015662965.1 hypothetical protein ABB37_01068 [Leptomonas pyrrhocoris]KPA84525.1 hypothetical protein ABB37_01068 [Leptomonas pyrrhocoris]KPA84526.1 hypothetical protein ABB37_01068 [Leptomonas pyrrhocoris]|eukprot:XP_015662964.1 hypothetical protein ABB37_01068 [Leptomonas pyrrhocoris]